MNRSLRILAVASCGVLFAACGGAAGMPRSVPATATATGAAPDAAARTARASLLGSAVYPVVPSFLAAFAIAGADPAVSPPGANVAACRPSAQHPYPVVLVHGTAETMEDNYGALAPVLANNGYCVYALNYGGPPGALFEGLNPIPQSAQQVATFVAGVLAATGARQVDFVGHSQGGTLGAYYAKFLGGAPKLHTVIALAPSTHGTTFDGIVTLGRIIPGFGAVLNGLVGNTCPSCVDQEVGSAVLQKLDAPPVAQPGPKYTVIATLTDEVITPPGNGFIDEPGVTNEWLQSACPFDTAEHVNLSYDLVAIQLVLNALAPATARQPNCLLEYPFPA